MNAASPGAAVTHDALLAPPHSLEAEQSVIGGLLLVPSALDRIDWLSEADFYSSAHRMLYATLRRMSEGGRQVDTLLLADELQRRDELEKVGGIDYLGSLAVNIPSAANIARYAEIVRDKAILRRVITAAIEVQSKAYEVGADPREVADDAETRFLSVLDTQLRAGDVVTFGEAVGEAVDMLEKPEPGVLTGFSEIDRMTGGLKAGDLIVIAGRPSMGKTSLALNIAEHVASIDPVVLFTLESSRRAVAARSIKYHESLIGRNEAVRYLHSLKLWIDDAAAVTLGYVRLRLRRIKRKAGGLGLIVIDYLQLMRAKAENRTQEISEISRGLKAIAKEFNVPVIAIAQLSRGPENRNDHRPMLSDLRESGQIEQDADLIAFVYREEYYNSATHLAGLAEIIIRKHRDGPTGTVHMKFDAEHTRFHNHVGAIPQAPAVDRQIRAGVVRSPDFKLKAACDQ